MGLTQQEFATRSGMSRRSGVNLEGDAAICRQIRSCARGSEHPTPWTFCAAMMNDPEAKTSDRMTAAKALMSLPMIPEHVLPDGDAVVGGEIHVHFPHAPDDDAAPSGLVTTSVDVPRPRETNTV